MRFNPSIANRAILGGRSGISRSNNRCWVPNTKVVQHAQHQQHSHYVSSTTHKLTTTLSLIGITGSVLASRENCVAECAPVTDKLSAGGVKEDDNNKADEPVVTSNIILLDSSDDTHMDKCFICGNGGQLLCCDKPGCNKAHHAKCIQVDINTLPLTWYCPSCTKPTSAADEVMTDVSAKQPSLEEKLIANEKTDDDEESAFNSRRLSLQDKTSEQLATKMWNNSGCEWDGNPKKKDKDIVMGLLGSGDLYIFNANFDDEKLKKEMNSIVNDDNIMTERHNASRVKGEWYGTGGAEFSIRVKDLMEKQEDQVLHEFMQRMEKSFSKEVQDVFMIYYCNKEDSVSGEDMSGVFDFHKDNYRHRYFRIITTIGPNKGKTMSFRDTDTGRSVTFTVPHGTVVAMSQVASGADREGRYEHSVRGAEDSYILGFQL